MLKFPLGILLCLFGIALAGWIAYNVFIQRLVDEKFFTPQGLIMPLLFTVGLLSVGGKWMAEGWENLPSLPQRKKKSKSALKIKSKKRRALEPLDE